MKGGEVMTVAVIGGGAAGLTAALTAAEGGAEVVLLERQGRVGRKLLATGNGRCNLTNLHGETEHWHGADPAFARPALAAFGPEEAVEFFRTLGLLTVAEPSGRVYPLSDQAGSVVDVLRFAVQAAGVTVRTDFDVTALQPDGKGFRIRSAEETLRAERVILCCGGMAGGPLGGARSGYDLLKALGHRMTKLYPALVQLRTDPTWVRSLKGVRADAALTLRRGDEVLAAGEGEVQFTDYGVSGPAVFELSRAASTAGGELTLTLDLLRGTDFAEVLALLERRCAALPELTVNDLFTGMLHNRLGRTAARYTGLALDASLSALGRRDLRRAAGAVKAFALPVTGTQGFDSAQVTAGGARTEEFDPRTLQSRLIPGLYAAGELLDVDGDCGGYNLQWAWASGRLAGRLL